MKGNNIDEVSKMPEVQERHTGPRMEARTAFLQNLEVRLPTDLSRLPGVEGFKTAWLRGVC
jgi:hypothetical protein